VDANGDSPCKADLSKDRIQINSSKSFQIRADGGAAFIALPPAALTVETSQLANVKVASLYPPGFLDCRQDPMAYFATALLSGEVRG
jgi:hypothetical protein